METNPLAVSDPAPAFVASDEQGHMHRLAEYQGATVVLCFLPSPTDDSPAPRDLAEAFPGWDLPDVFLLGVQRATPQQAGEFRNRHRVPFPIVVLVEAGLRGRRGRRASRGSSARALRRRGASG